MPQPTSLDSLNERFARPGAVRFEAGSGALARAVVAVAAAEAHVYLHGGHVTHYRPAGRGVLLFLSERSWFVEVRDVRQVSVTGLGGATHIDKNDGIKRRTWPATR